MTKPATPAPSTPPANAAALAVMLRSPVPGRVKTRLVPPLTHVQAAALYERFIRDIFTNLRTLNDAGIDLFAAHTPESDPVLLKGVVPRGVELFSQSGDDLGDRIWGVFDTLFARGYNRVVVIGSDSPDMPPEMVTEALGYFEKGDKRDESDEGPVRLVLGPAADGGYFLVALTSPTSVPFEGIPWSTGEVFEKTVQKAREAGIRVAFTRPWHDIDRGDDLALLLHNDNTGAPESAAYLDSIGFRRPLATDRGR